MTGVQTATPGLWYHGSPHRYLLEIKSGDTVAGSTPPSPRGKRGIYFTQRRFYAEGYAGESGRIYSAHLVTGNPLVIESADWPAPPLGQSFIADLFSRAAAGRHDCILVPHIEEAVLLDNSCIRYLSAMVPQLETKTPGLFYRGRSDPRDRGLGHCFTLSRCYAEANARPHGHVAEVDLTTANPYSMPAGLPRYELSWLSATRARGHDCAVLEDSGDVLVFDMRCVRILEKRAG